MTNLKKWIDKFVVISSAGVPGGIKLLAMLIFPFFEGKNAYANFSKDFSFANALLMLSGVSYSIILYKKLSYADSNCLNKKVFWDVMGSYFSFGLLQVLMVTIISCLLFDVDFLQVIFLAIFTGAFFISRGYYIFLRQFYRLFFVDVISVLSFFAVILVGYIISNRNFVCLGICVSSSIPLFFVVFDLGWKKPSLCYNGISKKEVSVIGWSNFTSVGIAFFIPMLIQSNAGDDFVIYSSMASLVFSIITVIPRGMMNDSIGPLSLSIQSGELTQESILVLQKKIFYAVLILGIVVYIGFVFVMLMRGASDKSLYIYILSLCVFLSVGQLSIVEATIMYLGGQEKRSLFANILITAVCLIMAMLSQNNIVCFSPVSIMIGLIFSYLLRWAYYCFCMSGFLKKGDI